MPEDAAICDIEEVDRIEKWSNDPDADCVAIVDEAVPALIATIRSLRTQNEWRAENEEQTSERFEILLRIWRKRPFKHGWIGIVRWIVNAECREPFCHSHRLCWRWHIEVKECPTCGSRITEHDMDRMRQLMRNLWKPTVQSNNFNPTPPLVLTYDWRTGQVSNG